MEFLRSKFQTKCIYKSQSVKLKKVEMSCHFG